MNKWKAEKPKDSNGFWYVGFEETRSNITCYGENAEANAKLIENAPGTLKQRDELLELVKRLIKTLPPSYYTLKAEAEQAINSCK